MFTSVLIISFDIYQKVNYDEETHCMLKIGMESAVIFGIYWIFSKFISVISVNLLCLILFWRVRIKQQSIQGV